MFLYFNFKNLLVQINPELSERNQLLMARFHRQELGSNLARSGSEMQEQIDVKEKHLRNYLDTLFKDPLGDFAAQAIIREEPISEADLERDYLQPIRFLVTPGNLTPERYAEFHGFFEKIYRNCQTGVFTKEHMRKIIEAYGPAYRESDDPAEATITAMVFWWKLGYPGDYRVLSRLQDKILSSPNSDLDRYTLNCECAQSVPSRTNLISNRGVARIMSFATSNSKPPRKLKCLDFAGGAGAIPEAIGKAVASQGLPIDDLAEILSVEQEEAANKLAQEKCKIWQASFTARTQKIGKFLVELPRSGQKFDFIIAAGIFDYFSDQQFTATLKRLYAALEEDGTIMLGNYKKGHQNQYSMAIFNWFLNYRSAADLQDLIIEQAGIPIKEVHITLDEHQSQFIIDITRRTSKKVS